MNTCEKCIYLHRECSSCGGGCELLWDTDDYWKELKEPCCEKFQAGQSKTFQESLAENSRQIPGRTEIFCFVGTAGACSCRYFKEIPPSDDYIFVSTKGNWWKMGLTGYCQSKRV